MDAYLLAPSTTASKKYDVFAQRSGKRIVSFGAKGYSDYTIPTGNNEQKKVNYIKRHAVNEDWTDLTKAGTWARFILWNKHTVEESAKDMERRFYIHIKFVQFVPS